MKSIEEKRAYHRDYYKKHIEKFRASNREYARIHSKERNAYYKKYEEWDIVKAKLDRLIARIQEL